MSGPLTAVRRGRPRSEAIDAAITDATIEELIEHGYSGLSMERVAARAGVAKTTLYRRWPSTIELALGALLTFDPDAAPPPEQSPRDELLALLEQMRVKWNDPRYAAVMRRVMADGTAHPELFRHGRDRLITPSVRRMNAAIERAKEAGLIRGDADVAWVRGMLVSPIMASALAHRDRVARAALERTLDTVLRGLAP